MSRVSVPKLGPPSGGRAPATRLQFCAFSLTFGRFVVGVPLVGVLVWYVTCFALYEARVRKRGPAKQGVIENIS